MSRRYDAAGEFLIMKGFNTGDTIPAAEVQLLLSQFHELTLSEVGSQFSQWWKSNITHAKDPADVR